MYFTKQSASHGTVPSSPHDVDSVYAFLIRDLLRSLPDLAFPDAASPMHVRFKTLVVRADRAFCQRRYWLSNYFLQQAQAVPQVSSAACEDLVFLLEELHELSGQELSEAPEELREVNSRASRVSWLEHDRHAS